MFIIILVVINIPVYLFLAWVAFDTKESAADTFFETIVAILQIILIPRPVREMLGMDETNAIGIFGIFGFFFACAMVTYGEYWLLEKYGFIS